MEDRERALEEARTGTPQEMDEIIKFCCTEAEREQQLRRDELPRREKESQSAVNQLAVSNSGIARQSELSERFQGLP